MAVANPQPTLFVDADRLGFSASSDGSDLSAEEKARRERMRVAQSKGILDYYWSSNSEYLLIPAGTTLWMYNVTSDNLAVLPINKEDEKGAIIDAKLSPDSKFVSYLREDNNLYVFKLAGVSTATATDAKEMAGQEYAITTDGTTTIRNGVAEFVAQEEMSRMTGYWFSPQTKYIAFTRVDESPVENVQRNEVYADGVRMTYQRYPYAGKRNVLVQLCVVDLARIVDVGGRECKIWIPLEGEEGTHDYYLPRVKWVSTGANEEEVLSYQYQSRDQKLLKLKLAEVEQGFNSSTFESFDRMKVMDDDGTLIDLGPLQPKDLISTLLIESQPNAYVNLVGDGDLYFCSKNETLRSKKVFFWLSERDNGFKSIFMGSYAKNNDEQATLFRLTDKIGEEDSPFKGQYYVVDNLEFVDEKNQHLYFSGRKTSVIEKHLYRLDFGELTDTVIPVEVSAKSEDELSAVQGKLNDHARTSSTYITQVTAKKGFHNVSFSSSGDTPLFVDSFSSHDQPTQYSLWRAATSKEDFTNPEKNSEFITWVEENNIQSDHPLLPYYDNLNVNPEFGTFLADDDKTKVWYKLFVPSEKIKEQHMELTGSDKLPCLVYVYGGPHVQVCSTGCSWRDQYFLQQYFLQQGFIVLSIDNRGSSARGLEFESSIYLNAGQNEVSDQVRGVEKVLLSRDDVDPDKICMYGHSYGGYMSLMCLFRSYRDGNKCGFYRPGDDEPDTAILSRETRKPLFRCAIAGAPVSRWDLYDTHYTERYMGIPSNEFGVKSELLNHPEKPFLNVKGFSHSKVHEYVKYYNDQASKLMMYHGELIFICKNIFISEIIFLH